MNDILIRTTLKIIHPVLFLISIYYFLRGHNLPGGGFIAGLIMSLGLILKVLSNKPTKIELIICRFFSQMVSFCVMGIASVAALPLFLGKPVLSALWTEVPLPIAGKFSSVLVFDFFIYLLVALATTRAYIEFVRFTDKGQIKG